MTDNGEVCLIKHDKGEGGGGMPQNSLTPFNVDPL